MGPPPGRAGAGRGARGGAAAAAGPAAAAAGAGAGPGPGPGPGSAGLPALSAPVYSLVTRCEAGGGAAGPWALNLVTYASPVALRPRRAYALGLFEGTLSRENLLRERRGLLQVLREEHAGLTDLLGRQSSRDVDKLAAAEAAGHAVRGDALGGFPALAGAAAWLEVAVTDGPFDRGDHAVVLLDVLAECPGAEPGGGPVLYSGKLRELGIL